MRVYDFWSKSPSTYLLQVVRDTKGSTLYRLGTGRGDDDAENDDDEERAGVGAGARRDPLASAEREAVMLEAGGYTRSLLSSTKAVLVTPPRVPLSNRLGDNHAPNISHKMCLC